MTRRRYLQISAGVVLFAVLAFGVTIGLERLFTPQQAASEAAAASAVPADTPHITATLFYATADGQGLAGVRREVPLADGVVAEGRQVLVTQLEAPPAPYLSVIPPGTTLRAFYVTDRGDAFVDLSPEVSSAHPGGSLNEMLTVDAIVNAVTANLPSIQRVQILINGKEAESLAGHVDLRRPLQGDTSLIREPPKTQ